MLGKHWENGNTLQTSYIRAFEAYILHYKNFLCALL